MRKLLTFSIVCLVAAAAVLAAGVLPVHDYLVSLELAPTLAFAAVAAVPKRAAPLLAECPACHQMFNANNVGRILGDVGAGGKRPVARIRCTNDGCNCEGTLEEFGLPAESAKAPTKQPTVE